MFKLLVFLATLSIVSGFGCGNQKTCQDCTSTFGCVFDVSNSACKSALDIFVKKTNKIVLPLDCPAEKPSFEYTDDIGRNRALVYSVASNGDEVQAQTCLTNRIPEAKVQKQYNVACDWKDSTCSATLSLDHQAKAIVLAFRGTKGSTQFFIEAIDLILASSKKSEYYNGKVFSYFANAFETLWATELPQDLANLKNTTNYELHIFGHSLGGSLALLGGNALVRSGVFKQSEVKVVTLGAPRTGDYDFASDVTLNIPNTYRIIHKHDLITKLPIRVLLGQKNAYHNNFEVWYDNDMTVNDSFKINNRADDFSGSQEEFKIGESSHNNYFGVDMDNYHTNGCL